MPTSLLPTLPRTLCVSWLLLLLAPALARAHDFWLDPSALQPRVGATVSITLRIGQDFVGDTRPYVTEWFSDYRVVRPDGKSTPVTAIVGDDPAGSFPVPQPGLYLIGFRSTRDFVEIVPEKFAAYLKDEGLEFIAERRARAGTSGQPARELFSRCAKSLVFAGPRAAAEGAQGHDRVLGYTLELVPGRNPYALRPGGALPVRLLYEGKPLPGALVVAFTAQQPRDKLRARTDLNGHATLALPRAGTWLVKAVHMIEAPAGSGAQWESFWASLTFALPAP